MKRICLILSILLSFSICHAQTPVTKIFIVRHADRDGANDDLTALGLARANELKRVLGLSNIDSIFSTNTIRTKKTAQPLATHRHRPILLYSDETTVINRIKKFSSGKRVLVVGHSDTVDDLIQKCGCTPPASITPSMPTTQYDNLFLVLIETPKKGVVPKCEVIHMKYGAVTN